MRTGKFKKLLIVLIAIFVLSCMQVVAASAATSDFDVSTVWTDGASVTLVDGTGMQLSLTAGKSNSYKYLVDLDTVSFMEEGLSTGDTLTVKYGDNKIVYTKTDEGYTVKLNDGEEKEVHSVYISTNDNNEVTVDSELLGTITRAKASTLSFTASNATTVTVSKISDTSFQSAVDTTFAPSYYCEEDSLFNKTQLVRNTTPVKYTFTAYDMFSEIKEVYAKYSTDSGATWVDAKVTDTEANPDVVYKDGKIYVIGTNDTYQIKFFAKNAKDAEEELFTKTYTIVDETAEGSINYDVDVDKYTAYQKSINDKLYDSTGKQLVRINESLTFDLTAIKNMLVSDYFEAGDLDSLTMYYAYSGKSSYSSKSITSSTATTTTLTLTDGGEYSVYFTAKDKVGTSFEVDTEELTVKEIGGIYGWYDDSDNLVCPIFTFTVNELTGPEVTVLSTNPDACSVGVSYSLGRLFSITGSNEVETYTVYYMSEANYKKYATDHSGKYLNRKSEGYPVYSDFEEAFKQATSYYTELTSDDADYNEGSTITTTEDRIGGYYYVRVSVTDAYGATEAVSAPVLVQKASSVEKEKEYFKNNWLSFVFLGISVLSFIGILIVLFVKPKDENAKVEEATDAE